MVSDRTAFEAAMKRGHSHAWEKQWMKAIEQYELAMAEFPDDARARNSLAFAYFKAGRLREALREYRKASQLKPGDPAPVREMARILEELGRVADAAQTWMTLAQVHVRQKTLGRAVEAWREAIRLQPANKEAHQRLAEAYALRSSISEAVQEYLVLARLHDEEGERARAMECCQEALSLDGRSRQVRAFLESLALDRETGVIQPSQPSLVLRGQKLSPVGTAVQRALGSLAEAVLGDGEFTDVAEAAIPGKEGREALPISQLETATVLGTAIDCHSRGMVEKAIGFYEQAFQMGAERVELAFNLALLYKETLRFKEAVGLLERSVEVSEYRLASHFALGDCYRAQGEVDKALDESLEALRMIDVEVIGQDSANEIAQLYQDLANSSELKGDGQATEVFFDSLTEFFSDNDWRSKVAEVREKLDSLAGEGAIPTLAEFLSVSGSEEILDVMIAGQGYLKSDLPYIALEECYRALEMAPTYLPLHLRLAEIFAHQGKVGEAVSKYEAVADAFLTRDNPHKAIAVYGRALLVAPMNISIREELISLLIDDNEMDRALEEYLALADGYYRLARVDEALDKYEEALLLVPHTSAPKAWETRILHRMADLHMQRVQWKKALAVYEKLGKLSPDDEEARLRLVDLHYKLGREDIALRELDSLIVHYGREKEFRKLIRTLGELVYSNPQDIPLRSRLSRIYIEAGMREKAITELDALGELQLEAGLKRDAMETLRTIISLKPKEEEGYTQLLRELGKDPR